MINIFRNIFKKIKNSSSYYYPRYYYYEQLVERYKDLSEYYRIIAMLEAKTVLKTNEVIAIFEKIIFDKITKKTILKKYGKPQFKYKIQEKYLQIEILFYKINIGGYRVKLELHMYERKLFYYNYTFTNNLNNQQRQEIIKIIQEKYSQDSLFDASKQDIIDENHTQIHIENSLELKIHYLNTMNNAVQVMSIYKKNQENEKHKNTWKKRAELLKRL